MQLMPAAAEVRAMLSSPPPDLRAFRPRAGEPPVALLCTLPGCRECARFERARPSYEARELPGFDVWPWNCGRPAKHQLARGAGVDAIPAYVVLTSDSVRILNLNVDDLLI